MTAKTDFELTRDGVTAMRRAAGGSALTIADTEALTALADRLDAMLKERVYDPIEHATAAKALRKRAAEAVGPDLAPFVVGFEGDLPVMRMSEEELKALLDAGALVETEGGGLEPAKTPVAVESKAMHDALLQAEPTPGCTCPACSALRSRH